MNGLTATPLLEFFKRGEVDRDVRLMGAQGVLSPRAHEQIMILVLLLHDEEQEIREVAEGTLNRIPVEALRRFLGRPDVPVGLQEFFGNRGVFPAEHVPGTAVDDEPLISDPADTPDVDEDEGKDSATQKLAKMTFVQRLKAASKGSKEMRSILIRDPNKMINAAVLSSPKLTDSEVETYAKLTSVSDDVLRTIANNRAWTKRYGVILGLSKNAKTPLALSMRLMSRLNDKDLGMLSVDRNVPEPLRIAAKKRISSPASKKE
jgi:hypothetical protein